MQPVLLLDILPFLLRVPWRGSSIRFLHRTYGFIKLPSVLNSPPKSAIFWTFCLINKMSKNDYFGLFWNSLFSRILGLFPTLYFCIDWQSNIVLESINTIWLELFSAAVVLSFAAILRPCTLLRIVHSRSFFVAGLRRKAYLYTVV